MSARPIVASASGYWPTPTARSSQGWGPNHNRADRLDYTVEREAFHAGQQTPLMRLNPDWVEWLMNWPIGQTSLTQIDKDSYDEWSRKTKGEEARAADDQPRDVRKVRQASDGSASPRPFETSTSNFAMQAVSHDRGCGGLEARGEERGNEALGRSFNGVDLRILPSDIHSEPRKAKDVLKIVRKPFGMGKASWWYSEQGIPRVTNGVPHRAHRIEALGNGQVPRVAAAAFLLLHGRLTGAARCDR